jgi:hypothetical protein
VPTITHRRASCPTLHEPAFISPLAPRSPNAPTQRQIAPPGIAAESVRRVQREAEAEFECVWAAEVIE